MLPGMALDIQVLQGLLVAVGAGLLVGVERERHRTGSVPAAAGMRTFALIGLSGALAERVGGVGIAVGGAFVVLAALAAYRASRARDPGLTTETAMLVVFLLGVLAMREPALAAGLGVLVALLLASKSRAHHFVHRVLTTQELHDALWLAAAAAVVLPLLPDRAIDPWQAINPRRLWWLAVLVMAISALGHIAQRAFGAGTGLLLAGFAGGFASSTATIASMGARARRTPALALACAGGGVISNVSTVIQLGVVVGVLAPAVLAHLWPALVSSGVAVTVVALMAARSARSQPVGADMPIGRAFEPRQALGFVGLLALIMWVSAVAQQWLGPVAVRLTLALSGFADVHAAAASAAQLAAAGRIPEQTAVTGIALALAANSMTKLVVAWSNGGRAYTLRLLPGVLALLLAFALGVWLS